MKWRNEKAVKKMTFINIYCWEMKWNETKRNEMKFWYSYLLVQFHIYIYYKANNIYIYIYIIIKLINKYRCKWQGWYNSLLKSLCYQTREMILSYNSLLKSLCYQTEESNPFSRQFSFSAIPFSAIISLQFHSLYQTHPNGNHSSWPTFR